MRPQNIYFMILVGIKARANSEIPKYSLRPENVYDNRIATIGDSFYYAQFNLQLTAMKCLLNIFYEYFMLHVPAIDGQLCCSDQKCSNSQRSFNFFLCCATRHYWSVTLAIS